jgi:hypothetical protein
VVVVWVADEQNLDVAEAETQLGYTLFNQRNVLVEAAVDEDISLGVTTRYEVKSSLPT